MGKVLTGQSGYAVGSAGYFRAINEKTFMAKILQEKSGCLYYDSIATLSERIYNAFDEIYGDLQKNIGIIQYIPKEDRDNLIKIILGLYDICKITSGNSGKCDDCISILSLVASETRLKSSATNREIEDAVKIVRDGQYLNGSDRMDVIRRAAQDGESYAAGSDMEKAAYLQAVSQGRGREFLGDVWLKFLYSYSPREFTGRCGRVICTREYIDHIEKHVFNGDISNYYSYSYGDRVYGNLVTASLKIIAETILSDLKSGEVGENYMTKENYENIVKAKDELSRFSETASIVSGMVRLADQYYTDLLREIEQLKREAHSIEIGDYEEWTNGNAIVYLLEQISSKSTLQIEEQKKSYVTALAGALKDIESSYEVPAIMIAGIAYMEFGGDPPIFDYAAYTWRTIFQSDPTGILLDRSRSTTSFGNISMQLRRAAETLNFYGELDSKLDKALVEVLNNDKTLLILVARHLKDLKNIDFPDKRATELTDEEMAVVVGRYNVGPDVDRAGSCGYARRFLSMLSTLRSWIN